MESVKRKTKVSLRFLQKNFLRLGLGLFLLTHPLAFSASAFLFQVEILDKAAISKMTDEQLLEVYIDAVVEVEAVKTFYARGGLVPREYTKLKELLRFKILLIQEIHKRGLEIPKTQ